MAQIKINFDGVKFFSNSRKPIPEPRMSSLLNSLATGRFLGGPDGRKFFTATDQSELLEALQSKSKKKEAVKQVIAQMSLGKENSNFLFPHVLKCIHTQDLQLKRLVYLYLVHYSVTAPDLVLLAVNTFCKDAQDANPLVRAAALRTMASIPVVGVLDYVCDPVRRSLSDTNAYVRRVAVLCVGKIWRLSGQHVSDFGLRDLVVELLLKDSNPSVVSSAIQCLTEMNHEFDTSALDRILFILGDASEWNQAALLRALTKISLKVASLEAHSILAHVVSHLMHRNASVVVAACQVIVRFAEELPSGHRVSYLHRLVAPLLSLSGSECPEIQLIGCKTIAAVAACYRELFTDSLSFFSFSFADPEVVSLEKIQLCRQAARVENLNVAVEILEAYVKGTSDQVQYSAVNAIASLYSLDTSYVSSSLSALLSAYEKYPTILKCCSKLVAATNDSQLSAKILEIVDEIASDERLIDEVIPVLPLIWSDLLDSSKQQVLHQLQQLDSFSIPLLFCLLRIFSLEADRVAAIISVDRWLCQNHSMETKNFLTTVRSLIVSNKLEEALSIFTPPDAFPTEEASTFEFGTIKSVVNVAGDQGEATSITSPEYEEQNSFIPLIDLMSPETVANPPEDFEVALETADFMVFYKWTDFQTLQIVVQSEPPLSFSIGTVSSSNHLKIHLPLQPLSDLLTLSVDENWNSCDESLAFNEIQMILTDNDQSWKFLVFLPLFHLLSPASTHSNLRLLPFTATVERSLVNEQRILQLPGLNLKCQYTENILNIQQQNSNYLISSDNSHLLDCFLQDYL